MNNDNDRNEKGQFVKGRKETAEDRLKRAKACSEAWKDRKDYIGDIRLECPKLYNIWRGIRFTEKGKKVGNSKEWDDFREFYSDVRPFYEDGKVFRRKDTSKIYSKDNFMFVTTEEAGSMQESVVTLEYNNQIYTLKQASITFGIPYNSIKNRYYKHKEYSVEEVIFGKKVQRKAKQVKDWSDSDTSIRAKASKMISSYRVKDIKRNLEPCDITVDWMIDNIIKQPCIYCGDTSRVGCDRIDNDKGHTMDNVVPCCYDCNCARNNNFTHEEMFIIGETIRQVKSNRVTQKS